MIHIWQKGCQVHANDLNPSSFQHLMVSLGHLPGIHDLIATLSLYKCKFISIYIYIYIYIATVATDDAPLLKYKCTDRVGTGHAKLLFQCRIHVLIE